MLENGWLDRTVLGVAFDGTGFGPDGTIWGGEFLPATAATFRRVAHLREFKLPGGEAAIREPWRSAVSLLQQALGSDACHRWFSPRWGDRLAGVMTVLNRDQFSTTTTSGGRLFDAVASLVLDVDRADFEGAPAMLLEAMADRTDRQVYHLKVTETEPLQLDWRPLIQELLADREAGVEPGRMSMRFHRGLAAGIAAVCRRFAPHSVVLSGGVFQNRLLTELVVESLADSSQPQPVGLHGRIPPNDGGLAAGQLVVGLAQSGCLEEFSTCV